MADEYALSGEIDARAFPFAIVDLHRQGATGSLKVEGPTYHKALYFRSGRVLFGSSNDPRDQLGSILIESGKLTPEQLEDVNSKVGPGNPLAKLLSESGLVSQRELGEAARSKVERILSDLFTYDSGSYEFEDGVLPKGAVDLKLSTEQLVIAAARRVEERAFVLRHIESLQAVLSPTLELTERAAELAPELGSFPGLIDGQHTLKELASESGLEEFEAAKISCALMFLGWARSGSTIPPHLPTGSSETVPLQAVAQPEGDGEIDLGAMADAGLSMSIPSPDAATIDEPESQIQFGGDGNDATVAIDQPVVDGPGTGDDAEDVTLAIPAPRFEIEANAEPLPEGHGVFAPPDPEFVPEADDAGVDWALPTEIPAEPGPADEELAPQTLPPGEVGYEEAEPDATLPDSDVFGQTEEEPGSLDAALYQEPEPDATLPEAAPYREAELDATLADSPPYEEAEADATLADEPVYAEPEPGFDSAPAPGYGGPGASIDIGMPASATPTYDPGPDTQPPQTRPSREDLAALDALLNERTTEGPLRPIETDEAPADEWKPQFLTSSAPGGGSDVAGRLARRRPDRTVSGPLLALAAFLLVAGAAAFVIYRMGGPQSAFDGVRGLFGGSGEQVVSAPPTTVPVPVTTLELPPELIPVGEGDPAQAPDLPGGEAPAPDVDAIGPETAAGDTTDVAPPGTATPTPIATPEPDPDPATTATAAAPADLDASRAALRAGRFDDAARGFATGLEGGAPFTLQVLVACARETVEKAVRAVDDPELYVLPVTLRGRPCFRVCWGRYESEQAARSGSDRVPAYFRQNGAKPRVARLAELLP